MVTYNRASSRSPFVAAFLSFLFPGLGQAAAGRRLRGLIVALPTIATILAVALVFVLDRKSLFNLALNGQWLTGLFWLDVVLLFYHVWAIVDAYAVAGGTLPFARPRYPRASGWISILGVVVIVSSTVAVHGAVAVTDSDWQHALYCVTAATPCWVTGGAPTPPPNVGANATDTPNPLGTLSASAPPLPTFDLGALPSFTTRGGDWTWNPNGQFNVLLAGIGVQDNPSQLGPDTIMVLHVDRSTGRAALISIGRNNVCVPLPQGVAQHFATSQSGCPPYTWPGLINDFPNEVLGNCRLFPLYSDTCGQPNDPNRYLRAYKTFEQVVGGLLGLQIDGSMWINPAGLTRLIDDVGGLQIDVPSTVTDGPCGPAGTWQARYGSCGVAHNGYSVPTGVSGVSKMKADAAASNGLQSITWTRGQDIAMTIKAGQQHMDGDWALAFARTRIYTSDFDRAKRQQLVLKALRDELDPCRFASPSNLVQMLGTLKDIPYAFNTDLPITNTADLQEWANLAKRVVGGDVKSIVLDPASTGESFLTLGGITYPAVDSRSWARIQGIVANSLAVPIAASPSPSSSASAGASGSESPSASPNPTPTQTASTCSA